METRMKESEESRVKDLGFVKDTFKKLIFALEQNNIVKDSMKSGKISALGLGTISNQNNSVRAYS